MIQEFIDFLKTPQFRVPDEEFFRTLWPTIVAIVRNPSSNPAAAAVIAAIVLVLLVMVGLAITYFMLRLGEEEEEYVYVVAGTGERVSEEAALAATGGAAAAGTPEAVRVKARWVKDPLRHHKSFLWTFGIAMLVFVAAGVTTQSRSVCISCHEDTPHVATTSEQDPHHETACVRCHEGGNPVASVTISVVPRVTHMVQAVAKVAQPGGYDAIGSRACRQCHRGVSSGVTQNERRALRMSHAEPLAAGAVCLDCHKLDANGAVTGAIGGMDSCLRCHDGTTAAAECATCHTGDVSRAVAAGAGRVGTEPRKLIGQPDCYSCHDPEGCDSCHGVRLPHPEGYIASHMRDAAVDLWDNNGKTCFSCHTAERRSCYQAGCHEIEMPMHSADGSWRNDHQTASTGDCEGCHNRAQLFPNTCAMCHPQ